jgi:hypothetical protein
MTVECFCQRDPDGRCDRCAAEIAVILVQYLEAVKRLADGMAGVCTACAKAEFDRSGAFAIRDVAARHSIVTPFALEAFVVSYRRSRGIEHTPLMDLEIRRLRERAP